LRNGNSRLSLLKKKIAREAALLLYTSQEKEYKQAKKRASENLRARILPSNLDVALELDEISEEREGPLRNKRLIQMREEALRIMQKLKDFSPRLVGSLWRGTINRNSDIDIIAFAFTSNSVLAQLQKSSFSIAKTERISVTKEGRKETSFHIYLMLPSGNEAEIVVRPVEKMNHHEKCEIYGDMVTGLNTLQLTRVLRERPLARFIP
jgi:predicted nucleotidyltransferase